MKKIILLMSVFLVTTMNAQNLIENGGFEKTRIHMGQTKFEGWSFHRYLVVEKASGKEGNGAKVYANNASFRVARQGQYNVILIEPNTEYTLSFWLKGDVGGEEIEPILTWYDKNGKKLSSGENLGKAISTTGWTQKKNAITSPSVAVTASLAFWVYDTGRAITIDDVVFEKTGKGGAVPMPSGFEVKSFQREIEMSWHRGQPNTKWEIVINGVSKIVKTNKYTATNLIPNKDYKIKLRTIIGKEMSKFTEEKNIRTKDFYKLKDDMDRVPHLRTLSLDGVSSQTVDLFFNDLYNIDAEMEFFIDGEAIEPKDNKIYFNKKGKQVLKININESEDAQWEMEYNLNVK